MVLDMDIREIRRARLLQLVQQQNGAGKQRKLAAAIGKAPAQISQWINQTRTITEDSAREIEAKAKLPIGWLDLDPDAPTRTGSFSAAPHLASEAKRTVSPPPIPPRDFSDRRSVSGTDWDLLQDIKTAATPEEIEAIRARAAMIERIVAQRLAGVCDTTEPAKPPKKGR